MVTGRKKGKKWGYAKCRICGKTIRYKPGYVRVNGVEPGRLKAIRRHWSKKHPILWKKAIRRGVKKRLRK